MNPHTILIFTDGSSRGNPGPGGWGAVIACPQKGGGGECDQVLEIGGREDMTTNNRMELTAAVQAIKALEGVEGAATIHTDSSYVVKGITQWVNGWKKNNWQTKTKDDVSNRDLWEELDAAVESRKQFGGVTWKLIEGHVGVPANERADIIATAFADNRIPDLYKGDRATYPINLLSLTVDAAKKEMKGSRKSRSTHKAYSYVSLVDGKVETHATWAECEARVKGKKARFKKSFSAEDERDIIEEFGRK